MSTEAPDKLFKRYCAALASGRFSIESDHALPRMMERGVSVYDIQCIGNSAFAYQVQKHGRMRIHGIDSIGEDLDVVVEFDGDVVVVTVI